MSKIVAFCGSKFSGKSTSATFLKELVKTPVEEIAIAGHLKEVCAEVFNLDMNLFLDPALKEVELENFIVLEAPLIQRVLKKFNVLKQDYDTQVRPHIGKICRTPRALLQYIGTEVLHPIDPLIHVKVAVAKKDPNKITLITDLRFPAEFDYLKKNFESSFYPVYVRNPAAEIRAAVDSHASERKYVEFVSRCRLLNNEGSLQDLRSGILKFVEEDRIEQV